MAVGLLGGTFNPVHLGHLITSRRVREMRKLEKIILMPCYISPFKVNSSDLIDGEIRVRMLELAVENLPCYEVSDFELKKGGVSYTYDTIMHLKEIYKDVELIIGFDNIYEFHKWYRADDIIKEAKLIVLTRKTDLPDKRNRFFELATFVESPTIEISSTEIRERVRAGLSIDFLAPRLVVDFIKENKIYL
ncbi:MAG: nicotinate (nicotinamide) nucleotide adenylyltransferase [Ignavibacteriales bacterium]|jgi:nicotinate (nicotinamide) nucleotide adenylyltransferase|nr:MAG: nicotinate (nicotinamide) nucleotide adenylyltransferase [Ignavibacteriaceae bacterium]MBW7872949.1 nicotinate (nicotinamide) nucleotide adenylyltransferase [Ignavibacteria bacterium]MCZ2142422.1 nicotinate (nicotinamide) nucleotide adenylyltransferase [Ignavibacteriales bacterium]OQY79307.1 MAG: nicotinate (nicotinamide) nucleotide adenylyltransferase [Ignavibacteriales bacterium UTCHB3]MBV6445304.1 putative nicotinate-nucleotide adenylyltransferase [Ignavibacteriaceae bacterium]